MLQLDEYLHQLTPAMIQWRHDFHLHAESGWLESRTVSKAAEILDGLNYQLALERDVIDADSRMGLSDGDTLAQASERVHERSAPECWLPAFGGGFAGAAVTLDIGRPSPAPALRADMDALDLNEQHDDSHHPCRDHFVPCNAGMMHAYSHDSRAITELGLAHVLKQYAAQLNGMVKLIFQPVEGGTHGARATVAVGVMDGVDYFIAIHIGTGVPAGIVVCDGDNFMVTTKFDVQFSGVTAHAGDKPEEGRNALLAAAQAVLGLHTVPPYSAGASWVNVEVMQAGTGHNAVPSSTLLEVKTRGESEAINQYMSERTQHVVAGVVAMCEVHYELRMMGAMTASASSPAWVDYLREQAVRVPGVQQAVDRITAPAGSEDATLMMTRVQVHSGLASYVVFGTRLSAGHHNEKFDFDESVMALAVETPACTALNFPWQQGV